MAPLAFRIADAKDEVVAAAKRLVDAETDPRVDFTAVEQARLALRQAVDQLHQVVRLVMVHG